ncbi:MAG TPA: glycosyltransferase family 87 protein [Allosphingosinicella sp.]|nr:glycosyltransferase family 87 protein [Allosphingosinicella sp.]
MSAEMTSPLRGPAEPLGVGPRRAVGGWEAFWILAAIVAAAIFLRDLLGTGAGLSIAGEALWGRDFVNVYSSGALVLQGRLELLYDVEAYRAFQLELLDGRLQNHNYSYPPVTLLYTWLFALLPYPAAWIAWLAGTGALFALAARPYLRSAGLPAWAALLAPASLINLWAGHYGFLIGALWLSAWRLLPRRPGTAGILIGLMVVKPHLAVLAPIVLLWRREWRAFAAAAATSVALAAVSAALFGPHLWATYLTETALLQAAMVDDVGAFFLTMMPTPTPALVLLGLPTWAAATLQAVVALAAIVTLLRYLPSDSGQAGLATATATFLVLPYAFAYDMTVAGLAGLILFRAALADGPRLFALAAGTAAFTPMAVIYLNAASLPLGPLLIAFQLLAMLGLLRVGRAAARTGAIPPPG